MFNDYLDPDKKKLNRFDTSFASFRCIKAPKLLLRSYIYSKKNSK